VFVRMVMTSFVVGSGGSAGLFGTSVVVGAFLGTAVGGVSHDLLPGLVPLAVVPVFSIIGMMSFFGGISKAPLGVLIMVVEMAGTYTILPAAMLSIFVAYVATGRSHMYSEQLPSRLQSPAHIEEYRSYFLSEMPIGVLAAQDTETVAPGTTIQQAMDLAIPHGHANLSVEDHGEWFGGLRLADMVAIPADQRENVYVIDLVRPVDLLLPNTISAFESLRRMNKLGVEVAAVVSGETPVRVVGLVTRHRLRNPTLGVAPPEDELS
jgi:chloride channel protein, CIC family